MSDLDDQHGILYPAALPSFQRRDVPAELDRLARWYWIARWSLPEGESLTQTVLPFPAANLVVQPAGVTVSGATTSVSTRELTGQGWAFGVLLRPAGLVHLGIEARSIVDIEQSFAADGLAESVGPPMDIGDVTRAAEAMSRWWLRALNRNAEPDQFGPDQFGPDRYGPDQFGPDQYGRDRYGPDEYGLEQAERLLALAEADPGVIDVPGLAAGLGISVRAVQRLAKTYIGLTPLRVIRRYRLQEAALRLRENPELTVARVAAELGYADQSHLAADFRTTLGLSPRDYRNQRQP